MSSALYIFSGLFVMEIFLQGVDLGHRPQDVRHFGGDATGSMPVLHSYDFQIRLNSEGLPRQGSLRSRLLFLYASPHPLSQNSTTGFFVMAYLSHIAKTQPGARIHHDPLFIPTVQ